MVVTTALKTLLWALRYPSFPSPLTGEYNVGAIQTRIPSGPACQIHYPTLERHGSIKIPYIRPSAVLGLADYTQQNVLLLEFLSQRHHPCAIEAPPIPDLTFPVVVFSHGLGGCMEMYTTLCQQIASHGYWVVAMEHEDGSGAYAVSSTTGKPMYYRRPDDTPYSRKKVVEFRKDFLNQRVQEIQTVLDYIQFFGTNNETDTDTDNDDIDGDENNNNNLPVSSHQKVWKAANTQQGIHLVGHSFGGATMVQFTQQLPQYSIESLSLLDCWAFSLPDESLEQGLFATTAPPPPPTLSLLSEAWLTNPETEQLKQLLFQQNSNNTTTIESWYIPKSVHASFSDASLWLPGPIARAMGLRAPGERKHATITTAAQACVRHFDNQPIEKDVVGVQPFPIVEVEQKVHSTAKEVVQVGGVR